MQHSASDSLPLLTHQRTALGWWLDYVLAYTSEDAILGSPLSFFLHLEGFSAPLGAIFAMAGASVSDLFFHRDPPICCHRHIVT